MNVGDRVQAVEQYWDRDREEMSPRVIAGIVVVACSARELYPKRPSYSARYLARSRTTHPVLDYKYEEGDVVYQVLMDGEKCPRNFHQDQLTPEAS